MKADKEAIALELAMNDTIHKFFSENNAKLHIAQGGEYARIECWKMEYYFHGSKDNEVVHTQYETMDGVSNKTIVPYDWRELSASK